jgi:hypothetical protein
MCLRVSYEKKNMKKIKKFLHRFKSLKKGVGSGSVSQRYRSAPKCHGSAPSILAVASSFFVHLPCGLCVQEPISAVCIFQESLVASASQDSSVKLYNIKATLQTYSQ